MAHILEENSNKTPPCHSRNDYNTFGFFFGVKGSTHSVDHPCSRWCMKKAPWRASRRRAEIDIANINLYKILLRTPDIRSRMLLRTGCSRLLLTGYPWTRQSMCPARIRSIIQQSRAFASDYQAQQRSGRSVAASCTFWRSLIIN